MTTNQGNQEVGTNKGDRSKVAEIRNNKTKDEGECGKEEHRSNLLRNQTKNYKNNKITESNQTNK